MVHIFKSFIIIIVVTSLCSCAQESEETVPTTSNLPVVHALLSSNRLGDQGYNDNVFRGLCNVAISGRCELHSYLPANKEEADSIVGKLLNTHPKQKSLIILAESDYSKIAEKYLKDGKTYDDYDILLFQSGDTTLNAYTRQISLYGVSYAVARLTYPMNQIFIGGSSTDAGILMAEAGFHAGVTEMNNDSSYISTYLANDNSGFEKANLIYGIVKELMTIIDDSDVFFIYPVAGSSNMGIYRELHETEQSAYTTGMDGNFTDFCPNVLGNVFVRSDSIIETFVYDWLDGKKMEKHKTYGLSSGMVYFKEANVLYNNVNYALMDSFIAKGIIKEKEYLKNK